MRFGFALLGMGATLAVLLLAIQPDARASAVARLIDLLQAPQSLAVVEDSALETDASPAPAIADEPQASVAEPVQALQDADPAAAALQLADAAVAAAQEPIAAPMPDAATAAVGAADAPATTSPQAPATAAPILVATAPVAPVVPVVAEIAAAAAPQMMLAANPRELPRPQAEVARWLSKKYRVAAEPLSLLVAEAWELGRRTQLDWTLILAVMAVESSFNPFAQSSVGAQGLMQVMTRLHSEKYDSAGGELAAFNPVTNLRVGVEVLLECIDRAGSLQGGLKYYVGAANLGSDGGYAKRVLAEQARLKKVAAGRAVS